MQPMRCRSTHLRWPPTRPWPASPETTSRVQAYDGVNLAQGDAHTYDGHVALVLDPGLLPEIDSMLDLLTSSHDLFDVPAMDIGGSDDVTST